MLHCCQVLVDVNDVCAVEKLLQIQVFKVLSSGVQCFSCFISLESEDHWFGLRRASAGE